METTHPPYGIGALQPRRLNRWLDVNAQNGPLTRTATYLIIPPVAPIEHAWLGVSDIVGVLYFESSHNFSFISFPHSYTRKLNFLMCVAWEKHHIVKRYVINDIPRQGIFFLDAPVYDGQMIGHRFRIEMWSIDSTFPKLDVASPPIYTTVLGELDYRFGDDESLFVQTESLFYPGFFIQVSNDTGNFTFPFNWPKWSTFRSKGPIPPPEPGGDVVQQVYIYNSDPNAENVRPFNINFPAWCYQVNGQGPSYSWNVITHIWE